MIHVRIKRMKKIIFFTILMTVLMIVWYLSSFLLGDDIPFLRYHMMNGWMMPFGLIFMVFVWIGCIYFIFDLLDEKKSKQKENVFSTLKERLAKGEISVEEYESICKKLMEDNK